MGDHLFHKIDRKILCAILLVEFITFLKGKAVYLVAIEFDPPIKEEYKRCEMAEGSIIVKTKPLQASINPSASERGWLVPLPSIDSITHRIYPFLHHHIYSP